MLGTVGAAGIVLVTVVAPAPVSAVTTAGSGAVVEEVTPPFLPASDLASGYADPVNALSAVAASLTVRVIGPTESCDFATPSTPSVGTFPPVGFRATTPA